MSMNPLRRGGGTWVNFFWVCVTGLSESLPHYSLFYGHIVDPILVCDFGKYVIFAIPT